MDNVEEIRKRHAEVEEQRAEHGVGPKMGADAHADRGALLEELEKLRAKLMDYCGWCGAEAFCAVCHQGKYV